MKRLHIIMATIGFYPAEAWGGPVRVVYQNALELQRRGHKVTVITSNLLNKKERIEDGYFQRDVDGLKVHYLPIINFPNWPGTLGPTMLTGVTKKILKSLIAQADVVHVHAIRNAISIQAGQLAYELGVPFVAQPHGSAAAVMHIPLMKKLHTIFFLHQFLEHASATIALHRVEIEQIIAAGGNAERVRVVPNGFLDNSLKSNSLRWVLRERYKIPPQAKVILFIGRINRKKGVDLLVHAFARIPEKARSDMVLVIVGPDDGQLGEVKELIKKYGLDSYIRLPGLFTGKDVGSAYQGADLFVLPCRVDTFPMAIVEACESRLPMVVTETCEIAEILDEKVARIVPVNADAIAKAIIDVLNDPELRAKYRQGADELMRTTFSIQAVGDQLEKLYEYVLLIERKYVG